MLCILERFGLRGLEITVNVDVHGSKQFLGWIFSLGEAVQIVGPDEVVKQMKVEIDRLI
ncbi:WYL domain-containing protein [Faecalicatena contorta]|uniref:WYL domain-containing protein n=1 Tax=Faecalicatena contorta TaxID=39482 RepID=UPI001F47A78D|nr:WYL domain-containing protein [Faecalicatena contorta]MCF2555775.1 WYL domain-containing protein [Faecalicatena contorta]